MTRSLPTLLVAILLGACASSPAAEPSPSPAAPAPEERAATPTEPAPSPAEPASDPAPADSAADAGDEALFRTAPSRWWHLVEAGEGVPGASVDSAWTLLSGREPRREVVVGVIDGGLDIDHEDLDDVLWVNEDEVPGNGVDDDGNGYVDDVHGWNFLGGPDGRSVEYDTYEMTRIHAACTDQPAGAGTPTPDAETCAAAAEAFEAEREEMQALSDQVTQIEQVYGMVVGFLSQAVGGEPTPERVARLDPTNPQLAQAQQIYLQLAAAGIDEDKIRKEAETIRGRLEYGLDLSFDPRSIVGDDYADTDERVYGNPDVKGPDPSHGTAVASVVAAERDNGVGIEGVAAPVRLMAVRAVPNGDERDKDVANAIRYAVDNGAHVINMSFGKDFSPHKEAVDEAVRYADEHGVLLVHASGNDGVDLASAPNFPRDEYEGGGAPDLWIEVGASSWQGADTLAAAFTNYGADEVDVFAPGVAIRAASPGGGYQATDGTSIAAPVVSGVAALLMAYFPDLTAAQVRDIILETATDVRTRQVVLPGDNPTPVTFGDLSVTGGIVNAAAAVRRAMEVAGG